ncbi:MAG: NAD-dependent epimerase/dehydratase family protein [Niastella sp.]|nr:NAD-dependent epimerase/dehydratase family protein [Niastella sp.]
MKKILITGANGFLGSNLTRELFRHGYEIKLLVRPGANLKGLDDIPADIYFGHIDNAAQVSEAVAGCSIVIHAASITDQWGIGFAEYERINFTATQYMVEASLQHHIEKFIYVSTANTIEPGSKENPGTELNGFSLFKANSGYINTKYLAQQYVLEQVQARQLPAIVVNPTFIIGPNDSKPSSGKLLLYGLNKRLLFYPPGGKNFVYIHDVCHGIVSTLTKGQTGSCYLLAGHNLTYREFFSLLNKIARQKKIMIRIPAPVLKLAGMIGTLKAAITRRPGKLTWSAAWLLSLDNYYSGQKAARELEIHYTPIETAISKALNWFKENHYY